MAHGAAQCGLSAEAVAAVFAAVGVEVPTPLERLTWDDVMLRYGSDRPDRRIGMEIADLAGAFEGSEFKVFSGALESGGVVRGFKASGEFPRKRFDELTEQAKSLGAKGLVWAVVEADGWRSPIAKFLKPEEMQRAAEILETEKFEFAKVMTTEMGKPIKQARVEIDKCAAGCSFYAENAQKFLEFWHSEPGYILGTVGIKDVDYTVNADGSGLTSSSSCPRSFSTCSSSSRIVIICLSVRSNSGR